MCASVDASVSIGSAEASTSTAHEVSISDDQPHLDAEAWRHIEALRALQLRVSDDETAALAAALARLQAVYSSRAVAAKERAGAGCCASCHCCRVGHVPTCARMRYCYSPPGVHGTIPSCAVRPAAYLSISRSGLE